MSHILILNPILCLNKAIIRNSSEVTSIKKSFLSNSTFSSCIIGKSDCAEVISEHAEAVQHRVTSLGCRGHCGPVRFHQLENQGKQDLPQRIVVRMKLVNRHKNSIMYSAYSWVFNKYCHYCVRLKALHKENPHLLSKDSPKFYTTLFKCCLSWRWSV